MKQGLQKNRPMRSIVAARCWKRSGRGGLLGQANLGVDVLKLTQAGQGSSHGMGLLLMTPDGEQELVGPSVGIPQGALQGLGLGQQSIQVLNSTNVLVLLALIGII